MIEVTVKVYRRDEEGKSWEHFLTGQTALSTFHSLSQYSSSTVVRHRVRGFHC